MRQTLLSISLVVATFAFVLQLPMTPSMSQLAAVLSADSIGSRLGQTVHEVVLNIRAQDKARGVEPIITHAHIMAVMCQENPKLDMTVVTDEGKRGGLTQVIPGTAKGLLSGQMAKGSCAYIRKLENGLCANPEARSSNPRCSIELGSCLFNYELKRCKGTIICAYNAYNTGSPRNKANGLGDFVRGYNASAGGKLCAKAQGNITVWRAIFTKIRELTNGQFKTNDFQQIMTSAAGWPTSPGSVPTIKNIGDIWRKSPAGQAINNGQWRQQADTTNRETRTAAKYKRPTGMVPIAVNPNLTDESAVGKDRASWIDKLLGRDAADAQSVPKTTLTCRQVGHSVQLRWACPSGTTISRGLSSLGAKFDTRGAGAGAISTIATIGAEYTLQCIKGHQIYSVAKCSSNNTVLSNPGISTTPRDVAPPGVVMSIEYDDGDVIWATLRARECRLTAGNASKISTGSSLYIGVPTQNLLIKLECNTSKGKAVKHKQIVVE